MSPTHHWATAPPPAPGAGSERTARALTRLADHLSALALVVRSRGVARRAARRDRADNGPGHHSLAEALAIGLGCDSLRSSGRSAPR